MKSHNGCLITIIAAIILFCAVALKWSAFFIWLALLGGLGGFIYWLTTSSEEDAAKRQEQEKNYSDPKWRKSNPKEAAEIERRMAMQAESAKKREQEEAFNKKRQELAKKGVVSCPNCGSTSIASVKSGPDTTVYGYSWTRELAGGCTVVNVCQVCGQRFYPGT